MAELTQGRVDIISRENGTLISQSNGGLTQTINLTEPSVVRINGTRAMVVQYERQGDDLILHMRDGSTVRYQKFFFDDVEGEHSELVFDDGVNPPEHALFPTTAEGTDLAAASVTPTYESLSSVDPLLLADNANISAGVLTAGGIGVLGLAGIAIGAAGGGGGGGGGGGNDGGTDNPAPGTPTISINPFASDNVLDNAEKTATQTLSGNTTNVEAGQLVTITLGGQSYSATVGADGSWSINVPADALAALAAGNTSISVSVNNAAGTVATSNLAITVEAPPVTEPGTPVISINPFAGDNVLDNAEKTATQTISGTTTNVEAGQLVTITLGGQNYSATVGANGSWSVGVPATALAALANGANVISVTVNNAAGTPAESSLNITVNGVASEPDSPLINIALFAGDDILDNSEKGTAQTLSGTTSNVEAGRVVTVTLGEQTFSATVNSNGSWSITLPPEVLSALAAGSVTITATVSNAAGIVVTETREVSVAAPVIPVEPGVTLATPFGDGILDPGEKEIAQTLSGSTTNIEAGQTVTVTLNGTNYTALVAEDGSWSVVLPADALAALAAGNATLNVSVTTANGTVVSEDYNFLVGTPAVTEPTITLDNFAGDNVLDETEKGLGQVLSGTTTNVEEGQFVTLTLNGQVYSAAVDAEGNWSITLPPALLQSLAAGELTLAVSVSNASGGTATGTVDVTVEAGPPTIAAAVFAGDGVLDATEAAGPLTLSGTTTGVEAGNTVSVTFNGNNYTGIVGPDGSWSIALPDGVLADVAPGAASLVVIVTNNSGTEATQQINYTVAAPEPQQGDPVISVDAFTGDDVLDNGEKGSDQTVSGTTIDVEAGQVVTLTLNGQSYSGTVESNGAWSINVPSSALTALATGTASFAVSVSNVAGDVATVTHDVTVNAPLPTLSVNAFTDDGVLDGIEQGSDQTLSGNTTNIEAGQIVTVTLGGESFTSTVAADGSWRVTLPAATLGTLAEGTNTASVSVTNVAGETASSDYNFTVTLPVTAEPTIAVNAFAGDDVLDVGEKSSSQTLSGTTENVEQGAVVTVSLDGQSWSATVSGNGSWSVSIPAEALATLAAGSATLGVSVASAQGTATASRTFTVEAPDGVLTVNPISDDGYLNAEETASPLQITGQAENVAEGAVITVNFNGTDYSGTVDAQGNWSVTVPADALTGLQDGIQTLQISATDSNGNPTSSSATLNVVVENIPDVSVGASVLTDGVLDATDAASDLNLSGSTGATGAGQTVTVNVGGTDYSATVSEDGSWTLTLPAADLQALPQGASTVTITARDAANNTNVETLNFTVDTGPGTPAEPTISVNVFANDDLLDNSEKATDQTLSGSTTNVEEGQVVTLTLNGQTYSAQVDAEGNWSTSVPTADLIALAAGTATVDVSVTNVAGATAIGSHDFSVAPVEGLPGIITINEPLSSDGYLNADDATQDLIITGTAVGVAEGQLVTVSFNNVNYSGSVAANGSWSITLPSTAFANIADGLQQVTASVTDANGAVVSDQAGLTVAVTAQPQVNLDETAFSDGVLSDAEVGSDQILSGTTGLPGAGQRVDVELNGKVYSSVVNADGSWSLSLPATDLALLAQGPNSLTVTVTDAANNSNSETINFTVDSLLPVLNLGPVAGDDGVLNSAEIASGLPLTGSGSAPGDVVTVSLNGANYSAVVGNDGNWTVNVPAEALQTLADGSSYTLTVTVSDANGNAISQSQTLTVDTLAPTGSINAPGGDGILGANDLSEPLILSGTGSPGDSVTVTLNGQSYTAIVADNGQWNTSVPTADLAALTDPSYPVSVTITNAVGNSTTQDTTLNVATTPPPLTVGDLGGDGVINAGEAQQPLIVSGVGSSGDTITVSLNGQTYSTVVGDNGSWSVNVPVADVAQVPNGPQSVAVTATDANGNTTTVTDTLEFATTPPPATVTQPASDGYINIGEHSQDLELNGAGGTPGNNVSVVFNGDTYTTTVGDDGNWSVTVPAEAVSQLGDGIYPVTVTIDDQYGNSTTVVSDVTVVAETARTLTIAPVTGDDVIDRAEQLSDVLITGTTNVPAGQPVLLSINGQTYDGVVQPGGSWSVTLPAGSLGGVGTKAYTVTITDAAGNQATGNGELSVVTTADPVLAIAPISEDNAYNATESASDLIISGSSANLPAETIVTVNVGGVSYSSALDESGGWSITVPAAIASELDQGNQTITVTAGGVEVTQTVLIATTPLAAPVVETPFDDGVLNSNEVNAPQTLSGTAAAGQTVTVTVGDNSYPTTVDPQGNWSVNIPPSALQGLGQGANTVIVTVSDAAGNATSTTVPITVDTGTPTATINPVAGDGIINAAEAENDVLVRGSAAPGSSVSVELNGETYAATVAQDGSWVATLPAADLQALAEGRYDLNVTVTTANGNSGTTSSALTIDTTAPTFVFNSPAGDGVLNAIEQANGVTFTGSGSAGDNVSLTLNNVTYTGTVDENGQWTLDIPASNLAGLTNGNYPITVTVSDAAGNTASETRNLTVDTSAPPLVVNPVSGDYTLNTNDLTQPLTISGSGQNGDQVSVSLNGKFYRTQVGVNGLWSLQIAPTDLQALPPGTNPLTITLTDAQGNQTTVTSDLNVATDPLVLPTITVDSAGFAGDGILNAAEQQQPQTLSGSTTNVEQGQQVSVTLEGTTYTGVVGANGEWSIILPPAALATLADGSQTLTVNVINAVGNTSSGEATFTVDSSVGGVALAPVSGDNYLNAAEIGDEITFGGSTSNIAAGSIVTVNVNGADYSTTVGAEGNWTLTLPAGTFSGVAEGALTVTTTVTDANGLTLASQTDTLNVLTTTPPATAGVAFGDGILNADEAAANGAISGTTGVSNPGQVVTISLNGVDYSGLADATGAWQVSIPAEVLAALPNGSTPYSVTVTDIAGNSSSTQGTFEVNTLPPALTLNEPAGDGILNATEVTQPLNLTGTSEGNALISATFNGTTYSVNADADGNWTLPVPAEAFAGLVNGSYPLTVTASNAAGNLTTEVSSLTVKADAASLPTLALNPFAGDNTVDGAERQTDQILSGTTTNVEAGQIVTLTIGGQPFTGVVQASGDWSLTVPSGVLTALADGTATYTVAVSDVAGNVASGNVTITANSTASGLALDALSGDNYLNLNESADPLIVTGTSANVGEGGIVTLLLNNVGYSGVVSATGTWNIIVPAEALANLPDGPQTLTVTAVDSTGATLSSTATLNVIINNLPDAAITTQLGGGTLNATDVGSAQTLSGSTGVTGDGQAVSVTLNGTDYSGTVDGNGNWSITLPAEALDALDEGTTDYVVTVSDAAGNTSAVNGSVDIDLTPPTLTLGAVAGDNIVNVAESAEVITLTGNSDATGQTVTITLNNQVWTTTVGNDGNWSLDLPAGALAGVPAGAYTLTATVSDAAGNSFTETREINVATGELAISIEPPFTEGYLSQAEAGQNQTLSGTTGVTGEGQTVTVTLGGTDYPAEVDANGNWTLTLESSVLQGLDQGITTLVVNVADAAGNTGSLESSVTVDFVAPTLTVNDIADDNVINAIEILQEIPISGTASLADVGQTVTVTFNGQAYQTLVLSDGTWSVNLPASAIQGLTDGDYPVGISLTDAAGNTTNISQTLTRDADAVDLPTLSVGAISDDNYVNRIEAGEALTISGTSTNLAEGQLVTVTLNGQSYSGTVGANGNWTATVPAADVGALADGEQVIVVTAADSSGNPASSSSSFVVVASEAVQPTLSVNVVAGDDVINANEAGETLVLSGSSTLLLQGTEVTVTLNDIDYSTTIDANGNWSISVPADVVADLPQGALTLTVTANDEAGNPANISHDVTVNSDLPALSGISLSAGDTLNLAESLQDLVVSGTTEANLPVSVTLNGITYTTTAADNGSWSLSIPAADLQQLADGGTTLNIAVTDADGNTATDTADLNVAFNTLPTLTLELPFGDALLSQADVGIEQTLSGTSSELAENTVITVDIGELSFTTQVGADGNWSLTLPANTLTAVADGIIQLTVTANDAAGNPAQASASVEVLQTPPALPTIGETQFGDNVINSTEAGTVQLITGTIDASDGQTVTVNVDGNPLTVTVDANGNWTASLPPTLIASLGNGTHTLTVVTTDRAGNTSEATQDFTSAITAIAQPTLDTPFGDGRINADEAAADGSLTGNLNIDNAASVSVSLNGTVYPATINGDGTWSLELPTELLQTLPDGTWPVTVTVTDNVGNTASIDGSVQVVVNTLPDVTLNLPFGNGALDATEAATAQTLSGTTGITGAGQAVGVTIEGLNNDQPFNATVLEDGSWTLTLSPADLATLANGTHTINVTATDIAGNSDTTSQEVITAVTAPAPTFAPNQFGDDNVLNINEAASGLTLTGTTGSTGANQAVSITVDVNGTRYTGTVSEQGEWNVNIPAGALSTLGNGSHTLNVTVVDAAGNSVTSPFTFTSDLTPLRPTVDAQFDDGFINAAQAAEDFTLSGTTGKAGAGQTVTVTMGDESYAATVDENGGWTVLITSEELAGFADGSYPVSVTATDVNGNTATISNTLVVDTTPPTITVNAFAGDNALNYAESIQPQVLSGSATGAQTGSVLTVSLNGTALGTATVGSDGTWSLTLTPAQLATFTSGSNTVTFTVSDLAGNPATETVTYAVDLTPPPGPLVTLGAVSGDNIVSTVDQAQGSVAITGTSANLGAGGVVEVVIGTTTYTTTIDGSGNWSTSVPATAFGDSDGNVAVTVNASGANGSVTTGGNVVVDLTPPTLTINNFATDNVVNANESEVRQSISGTASTSEVGRTVVVTLNGKTYNAIVQGDGSWSTNVPAADMQALADGSQTITAQLSDAAGNVTNANEAITVDTSAPLIELDAFLGDNLINAADILATQVLTGRAPGAEGETVYLYAGDSAPLASAVVAADGTFSLDLSPQVLGSLTDGALVFGVRVTDDAGNQTDATLTVNKVVNAALNLVVDSVFGDGTLSAVDTTVAQIISGTAESAGVGAIVSVVVGGTSLTASVGQDGKWAIVVPPNVLDLLTDGQLALDVTLTDAAGNSRTVGETVTAIVDAVPVVGNLVGLFGGDNLLNIVEAAGGQLIGGVIENAAEGSQVTVTFGSRSYTTTVQAGGNWSVTLPTGDLTSLLNGDLTLGVSVTDVAGNVASSSATIGIFTQQPSISLTSLFGDGILNLVDIATNQTISGVVNNVAAGSTVTLNVGNSQVTAQVGTDGAFSATVTPDILSTLAQGNLTVGASVTDAAGNTASTSAGIRVDTILPTISVNPLFGDGLLNVADALVSQVIGGVVGGAEAGSRVVVSIGGQQYATLTDASGNFSVSLSPTLLQGIADGNLTVGVSVTDTAGNTTSTTAGALVGIHNLPKVVLNPLFGDGVLNLVESLVTQTVSGTVTGVAGGSTVRLAIGSISATATVNNDGTFSTQLTPDLLSTLLGGNFTVSASVTDVVGNTTTTLAGVQLAIGNQPTLTLNTVFGDGVLSAGDLASNQTISGSSSNLAAGSTVSATLNGVTYTTKVVSGGSWSISVPKADLAAIADGTKTVAVTATDAYGNVANGSGNLSVISHVAPTVAITSLFGDNALSVVDVKTTQTISGTATNAEGSVIRVTVGSQTYSTTVNGSGAWSLSVSPANLAAIADGTYTVSASVTNSVGSSGSGTATLGVASHSTPTVGLNSYFGTDGYLNIAESNVAETISGTSTNAVGGQVSVTLGSTTLTGTIGANGVWNISVPSEILKAIPDGSQNMVVTVRDIGGNTVTTNSAFNALSHNAPLVGADPVLNIVTSLLTGFTVNGGSLYAAQGSVVKVTLLNSSGGLSNVSVTTTTDALGRYSARFTSGQLLSLSGLVLSALTAAQIRITDAAGNTSASNVTLLLGSLLAVPAATTAFSTLSVDDTATAAAVADHNSTASTSTEATTNAKVAAVAASSLVTEADTASDTSTTSSTETQDATATAGVTAVADDQSYTIGGVVITLADGTTAEGASVTGSAGDDTVNVSTLNFTHIDGGAGTDTLVLNGDHMTLDLTSLGLKVEHIEVLDLGTTGTNAVKLDLNEALNITDKQSDDLMIKGADGSQVMLANTHGGVWEVTGQRTVEGQTFEVYHNSALSSDNTLGDVLVQHNLQVHMV